MALPLRPPAIRARGEFWAASTRTPSLIRVGVHARVEGQLIPGRILKDSVPANPWNLSLRFEYLPTQLLDHAQVSVGVVAGDVNQDLADPVLFINLGEPAARAFDRLPEGIVERLFVRDLPPKQALIELAGSLHVF